MHDERITPSAVHEMRAWLMECEWADMLSADEFETMPAAVIVRGVARHYCGGLPAFFADAGLI